jgi:hypothetical protein
MRKRSSLLRRALPLGVAALVAVAGVAAVAMAAGGASSSRAGRVKVKCPQRVLAGQGRVTCRVAGHLRGPRGPRGPQGPRGQKGQRGAKGDKGTTGPAGVSGYEVVSQTFKEVLVPESGTGRGLSAVETVNCPGGKRVVGGGSDLGTNAGQSSQQRLVTVSQSAPNGTGKGWAVQLFNNSGADTSIDLQVYAICAAVS